MSTRNQNPQDDIFSKEQEEVIKRSFENFEQKLGISKETPEYLKKSFERKLVALSEPNKSFSVRWKGFVASVVTAFSIGLLISSFLMVPATVATRGVGDGEGQDQTTSSQEYVSLRVLKPKEFAFEVIFAALEADMEVEVTQAGGKYGLYIKPFRPNDKNQEKVRFLLGVKPEVAGTVNAIIGMSKK
jgi:hypothetical protein